MGAAQLPAPVHFETGENVVPAQDAVPHATLVPACSQPPPPLQLPVFPQGGLAAQPPWSSGFPAPTFVQAPVAQVWQRPHVDDAQQTPSTQKLPVRQSVVTAQVWPSRRLVPHRFVCGSQMLGRTQSASTV